MKHSITKPNNEIYAVVWQERGLLRIQSNGITFNVDKKVIPELIEVLQKIQKELS